MKKVKNRNTLPLVLIFSPHVCNMKDPPVIVFFRFVLPEIYRLSIVVPGFTQKKHQKDISVNIGEKVIFVYTRLSIDFFSTCV